MLLRRRRMIILLAIMVTAFTLAAFNLYNIQMVQGAFYAAQAGEISSQEVALEEFTRGEITDRNGMPLTGGYYVNRVVVFPLLMADRVKEMNYLAKTLNLQNGELDEMARNGAFHISQPLNAEQYQALSNADLEGVFVLPFYRRYGDKPLAVHVLGHIGKITDGEQYKQLQTGGKNYNLGDWVGRAGLEYFYEQELKGNFNGRQARVPVDARGRAIEGFGLTVETAVYDPGRYNVATTIDHRVQQVVEQIMNQYVASGAVVVMQAGSGDILAMASRPDYHPDPEHMAKTLREPAGDVFVNRSTSLFQPGSVFKVVLAAAAIENGFAANDSDFECSGAESGPVRCWLDQGHGRISFEEAFAHSCNPAFVEIGSKLGAQTLIDYADALGLSNQNITGYPVETDERQQLSLIGGRYNLANSSVGQGPVLVTPVQVTAMMNTIASGGVYYTPRLVSAISDDAGLPVREIGRSEPRQAINKETAQELQYLLREVVSSGVGRKAEVSGWGSAGKTGSAQVSGASNGVDAWFAGYIPAENPRYVITVLINSGISGGDSAAPVFKEIAESLMKWPGGK